MGGVLSCVRCKTEDAEVVDHNGIPALPTRQSHSNVQATQPVQPNRPEIALHQESPLVPNQTRQIIPSSSSVIPASPVEYRPSLNQDQSTTSQRQHQSSCTASSAKPVNTTRKRRRKRGQRRSRSNSTRYKPLTPAIFIQDDTVEWEAKSVNQLRQLSAAFILVDLDIDDNDYQFVFETFRKTAQRQLQIVKIQRVENPFLMGCYLLKKQELEMKHGFAIEMDYFHGTKECNLMSICERNFDWRLNGESVGHMFGKGVSFSNIATYASYYCDKTDDAAVKTMFLARVLESQCVIGTKNMELPPEGYDTAKKTNQQVIVKFYDDEFYPEFIIYFTGSPTKKA